MDNVYIHRIEVDQKTTKEELVQELAHAVSSVDNLKKEIFEKIDLIQELRKRIDDKEDLIIILKEQVKVLKKDLSCRRGLLSEQKLKNKNAKTPQNETL